MRGGMKRPANRCSKGSGWQAVVFFTRGQAGRVENYFLFTGCLRVAWMKIASSSTANRMPTG